MNIDWTKPVELVTVDSEFIPLRVLCTDKPGMGNQVVLVTSYGDILLCNMYGDFIFNLSAHTALKGGFLIRNRKTKKEGWVNLYRHHSGTPILGYVGLSEKETKEQINTKLPYITTVKIEWEE